MVMALIYSSMSQLEYTIHSIHRPLSLNTNENVCRIYHSNSMHKNRVKDRFYAVPNCYIQHSKNCATFTFTQLKNGVSFQQVLFSLCKSFHKSSTLQLIEQQPSGSPLQHTAKMFHLLITQPQSASTFNSTQMWEGVAHGF